MLATLTLLYLAVIDFPETLRKSDSEIGLLTRKAATGPTSKLPLVH